MQALASYFSLDLIIFIFFLALNLIIGLRAGREVKTVRDFAIGKKNFVTGTIVSTILATNIGGGIMMYGLQYIYTKGLLFILPFLLGSSLGLLVTGQVIAVRMGEFLNDLSVAEVMGNLYGKATRFITAISGALGAIGYVAIQFQVIGKVLGFLLGFNGPAMTTAAAAIVILYSAFGGIRSVTITDVFQFMTFSIFIPILALLIWNHLKDPNKVAQVLATSPSYRFSQFVDSKDNFLLLLSLMICYTVPALNPSYFQRISIAKDVIQVKNAFTNAAWANALVLLGLIVTGVLLLSDPNPKDPSNLLNYMVEHYSYPGLKGLIVVGVAAMAMSTADSDLNVATVLTINDIIKPLKPNWVNSLRTLRIFSILLGILALLLALHTDNLLRLLLLSGSVWMPVVTPILLLAIFGFRSTAKAALLGMGSGLLMVIVWLILMRDKTSGGLDPIPIVPGILANLLFFMGSHYLLRQPGGWIGIKDKVPLLVARQKRKEYWENLFHTIKELKVYNYLEKNLPERDAVYSLFGLYALGATYSLFFTIPELMVTHYQRLYDVAVHSVLICTAALLTYPAWPPTFRAKWFITYAWPAAICYIFFIAGIQLVLMSGFNGVQVMILLFNLMLVSFFLTPTLSLILAALGMLIGYGVFISHYGPISLMGVASSLQFNSIYVLLAVSTFLMAIFRNKNKQDKIVAEKNHLGKAYAGQKKELSQVIRYSQELSKEINENAQLFDANILAYVRQAIYHIKDYVQLEVSSFTLKKLIHDVKEDIKIKPFEEEPHLLVRLQTKQTDITGDEDRLKQLLVNAIMAIHEKNTADKPIQIILEDATLGFTISYIKNYIKEIYALKIIITTTDTLPVPKEVYMSQPIVADTLSIKDSLLDNLRIVDAHYGYAEVEQSNTHLYVIPCNVRNVRAKVMELLREPATPDPVELEHPVAIEVEKKLWEELRHTTIDKAIVVKALDTIKRYHAGVKRKSGEPFFTHPIHAALILLQYCQDQEAVLAALLHDTVEDTQLSLSGITVLFGEKVAFLVGKVTNLEDMLRRLSLGDHENIERLTDYGDKRAAYVKLADRMHNMRTISGHASIEKRKSIASETLNFFVPLAVSLGLTEVAEELKELSLAVLGKKEK